MPPLIHKKLQEKTSFCRWQGEGREQYIECAHPYLRKPQIPLYQQQNKALAEPFLDENVSQWSRKCNSRYLIRYLIVGVLTHAYISIRYVCVHVTVKK